MNGNMLEVMQDVDSVLYTHHKSIYGGEKRFTMNEAEISSAHTGNLRVTLVQILI